MNKKLEELLNGIIETVIMDENPQVLDDDIPDLLDSGEARDEAIWSIIRCLNKMKE
jgi:hypothetical protein